MTDNSDAARRGIRKLQALVSYLDKEREHALNDAMETALRHADAIAQRDREFTELSLAAGKLKADLDKAQAELEQLKATPHMPANGHLPKGDMQLDG